MKKSLICLAISLAYCGILTGCGGGTGSTAIIAPTPTPTPPPTPTPTLEQRVDSALTVSEATADMAEPEAIDTASDSELETSEPKSL